MKKSLSLLLVALLTGCASVKVCRTERTMVDIQNTGWFLFCFIPIASGDYTNPNGHTCRLFTDTVIMESNMRLLDYAMRKEGATALRDITSFKDEESVLFILFKRYSLHTSAELLFDSPEESTK